MNRVLFGDAVDRMASIPDNSVDFICADLPSGRTANPWDVIIAPEKLWPEYWRVAKENAAIVIFGQDKFTAMMMLSSKHHRYNLIWEKTTATGFLQARIQPLRAHEDMMVFYRRKPVYNPQKTTGHARKRSHANGPSSNYARHRKRSYDSTERFPRSVWKFPTDKQKDHHHPTQKPVALIEQLIKTYTNPGDVVLDNVAGSGTTAVACIKTDRKYILIEKDPDMKAVITERISKAL